MYHLETNISSNKLIGMRKDEALSMAGKSTGVVTHTQSLSRTLTNKYHCIKQPDFKQLGTNTLCLQLLLL